jgi:hypothetical protein
MSASTRWLVGIGVAVVAIVLVGVAVAATGGRVRAFPDGSPERTVQLYLEAVSDGDEDAALEYLSADLQRQCEDLVSRGGPISYQGRDGVHAALEEATVRDGLARVQVRLTETYGDPPFGGGESTHTQEFELRQFDGEWRFVESPWPLYCPVVPKPLP